MADSSVTVGKVSKFGEGQPKSVRLHGTREIAVVRVGGEFFAFDNVCTHDDGPLAEGSVEGEVIECPRHGARFSMKTGEALSMPAIVPIGAYLVEVLGEEVRVTLEECKPKRVGDFSP